MKLIKIIFPTLILMVSVHVFGQKTEVKPVKAETESGKNASQNADRQRNCR